VPKYFDKVIEIRHCHLTDERVNHVRNALQAYGRTNGLTFYDARSHLGFLRNIVIRTTDTELMLILIVGEDRPELLKPLVNFIRNELPAVTSLITIINTKHNDSYTDLPFICEYGTPFITERLGKYRFEVGPLSFFQTNTRQTERLYETIAEFLPEKSNIIYDLYCGTGSIGIFISERAKKIVGIEYVPSAVEDAYRNANLNGLERLSFHAGDMAKLLTDDFTRLHGTPDVVITDPPRAGMDAKVVRQLLRLLPERIVYVSCNPATQARDVALLAERYAVQTLQPVDMFPHTTHVENVALLMRKD
jgi:23S rRNA (uracil1939-C5)-methyltransferase